jgi:hypothetical protein
LLRLPRQVGRRDLVVPRSDPGLVGEHRGDDGADRGSPPRPEPPQRAAVEHVLLGQKARQQAAGIFVLETAGQMVGIPCHTTNQAPLRPTESDGKH